MRFCIGAGIEPGIAIRKQISFSHANITALTIFETPIINDFNKKAVLEKTATITGMTIVYPTIISLNTKKLVKYRIPAIRYLSHSAAEIVA